MTTIYRMGKLSKQVVKSSGVDYNTPELSDCFDDNCNGIFDEEPVLNAVLYAYCDLLSDINPIENRGDYSPGELDMIMDECSFEGVSIYGKPLTEEMFKDVVLFGKRDKESWALVGSIFDSGQKYFLHELHFLDDMNY